MSSTKGVYCPTESQYFLGKTWDVVVIGGVCGSWGNGVEFTEPNVNVREMSETSTITANDCGEEDLAVGCICVLKGGVNL
jgi:hypothetical protein